MESNIRHKGIVTGSGKGFITVNISPDPNDCTGCAISALCKKPECVTVPFSGDGASLVGKRVTISASASHQRRAILMLLVVPLLLLIGVLVLMLALGLSEALSSIVALGAVAVWYLVVYISPLAPYRGSFFKVEDKG